MDERKANFGAFWPFYLAQHQVPACRWLHFIGTSVVVATGVYAAVTQTWWLFALCPLFGYGPAWAGHFIVEKNRPATFTYPLWSLAADFRMWAWMLRGRLWTGQAVSRHAG